MHKADLHHSNKTLQSKLENIFQLRRTRIVVNWDQDNYLDLLQHFGNPHKHIPPVIHVAGTNGKGSIIAMLRGVCEAAGMRVHSYTSPHLMHVNERIVLAGQQIDDDRLESLIDEALAYIGDKPLSFFEVISAVAFKAFSETPADILLLEVGMGGRLDCTNVIEDPLVSVISRISMDHTMFLGDAIEEIAAQKAGIIKHGVPCVAGYQGGGEQGDAVLRMVQQKAQQAQVPLFVYGQNFSISYDAQDAAQMCFSDAGGSSVYPVPKLQGEHQLYNAAVVLEVLRLVKAQGIDVLDGAISEGLQNCQWPGRLQRIDEIWPGGAEEHEIWLDCGHNDSAGEALAAQLKRWNDVQPRPTFLIVGMLGSKDSKGFLRPLLNGVSGIYAVPISSDPTAQSAKDIQEACGALVNVQSQDSFKDAVEEIISAVECPARILIVGSVYLAGEVLRFIRAS